MKMNRAANSQAILPGLNKLMGIKCLEYSE